jgi:uncharacterized protein YdgA (DUF945 family)
MNKSAGVLLGIVVAIGAISAGGGWYTGTKLEGVLQTSISDANKELQSAMVGSQSTATLELVSLDRQLFSSTAHYRLKGQGAMFGEAPEGVEFLFVDRIEHGPLPFSRLVTFKWLPVLASSRYELEKSPFTEKWFAATKDVSPLKGEVSIGYDRSTNGTLELLPLELVEEQSSFKFSGLNLKVSASPQAQKIKADGYMDSFILSTTSEDQSPVKIELNGLTLASNLSKSSYGYYLGQNTVELASTKTTFGDKQSVLTFKKAEVKSSTQESGTNAAGRADYKVGEVVFDGKSIGGAQMAVSMKNLDIPATISLMQVFQSKLKPYEAAATAAAAAGEPAPELEELTEVEVAQVKADLNKLLDAKPQIALENLSFNTANGESRVSLVVDLAKPQSMDLPPVEAAKQLIALLDFNLLLSKSMISDVASVQAQMEGQTDAKMIADQATMASEMVGSLATGTQLAILEGNNIVSKLRYANNQVDFNGQKMTVEEFVSLMMGKIGGAVGVQ